MTSGASISVVIPAHNSAPTLARAIDSVLAQSVAPLEVLIVDDCSQDDTVEVARSYADRGVRVVAMTSRGGASGARNAGVTASQGELIAFLDSDDEWLPGKLARQVPLIVGQSGIAFVSGAAKVISSTGEDLGDLYGGRPAVAGAAAWKALLAANFIATPTVLVWRHHLVSLGGFDPRLKVGEDQDMWIRLSLLGDLAYVPEDLVRVHMRPDSLSSGTFYHQLEYTLPMIERHLAQLADRLDRREIRKIRGERLYRLGRSAYHRGQRHDGARLIRQAIGQFYRPLDGMLFVVRQTPPMRWLESRIRKSRPS